MKVFANVDVQECLRSVVEENTLYYKTDFEYDIGGLKEAGHHPHGRHFLWLSRESGTYLFDERQVFLTPSAANHSWLYYRNHPDEVRAFYVQVEDIRDGRPRGSLIALDYPAYCKLVDEYALPAETVRITFNDGYQRSFPVNEFAENRQAFSDKYSHYYQVEYNHPDLDTLMVNLHSRYTSEMEPYDFERYLRDIRQERFARYGHPHDNFVWINQYDARKCLEVGIDTFVFEKDGPCRQLRSEDEISRLRYQSGILGIREREKPLLDYINSAGHAPALFQPDELRVLATCTAFGGTTLEWNTEENKTLQSLLGKLLAMQKALGEQDAPVEAQGLEAEPDMEPEQ